MNKKTSQTKEELLSKISQLESKIYASEKSELNSNKWFENSPVCTQLIDLDFNLKYINKSGIRDLKINDITEFYGKPYPLSFFPDSFKISMSNNLKRAKKTGETITLETPTLDMEGNTLSYHSTIVPVYNNQNHLDHIMIVSLKTTISKQVEEALIQNETIISNKLKAITEPKGDIGNLELSDIIDTEILQTLMEDFYRIAGMAVAVLDVSGEVLVSVGWQDICTKFHRSNPETLKNCIESDTILAQGVPEGTCKSYHCKNNMWDIVTPLMIGGKHIGNVFMGQYFLEGEVPDIEYFRNQAKKYGFDEKKYLAALDKVPRFSQETVDAGMKFYSNLAKLISSLSYNTIQQSRMLAQQKLADQALRESEERFELSMAATKDGLYDWNLVTNEIYYSPGWKKMLGYNDDELPNDFSVWNKLTQPKDIEKSWKMQQKLINKQIDRFEIEFKMKHKNGHWIDILSRAEAIFDNSGKAVRMIGTHVNISDSKQKEQLILKNKKRFEFALQSVKMGAWELDMQTMHSWRSFQHDLIFGYTKPLKEWTYDMFLEHVVAEDKEEVNAKFQKALSTKTEWNFECRINRKDGCVRWISALGNQELDEHKEPLKMFGVVQDITERKQSEEKIKDSEEKYKALYENAPLSYQSLNENGTFKDVNPFWLETLGYERHEVIGQKYADFLHPDWTAHFEKNFPLFKKRGYVSDVQFKIRHKKGHYLDIAFEGCIGYNPDGSVRQTYCVFQDITHRKQAENKLKISENRLKTILNSSPFPIAMVDVKDDIIRYWSISAIQLFGHNPKTTQEWYELAYPDSTYRNEVIHRWKPFMEIVEKSSEPLNTGEYQISCKDGSIKICELYLQYIPGNLIVTFNDITERKHTEEKIRATEENLKNTFDLSPSIICKANLDAGHFIEANQAVTRILGYTVEEFTSRPFNEFIHPDDQQKSADEKSEQLEGKDVTFFENRYLCKDGSYKWMAWHATKADENGIATAIASDISKRKIIEHKIVETKQFYENIIEGVQDGIWVTNKDDVIFYANSAMERIAGVPREQIHGNNILNNFPKETIGEFSKFYKQAKKEKKPVWYEIQAKTLAKKDVYQNGWLIPQYQNNKFSGIICTVRDITERKKAEGTVRKLSTAVHQSPSSISIFDTKGKLEYVNPKYTKLTGYTSSESIGQKSKILKPGKQNDLFYSEIWKTVHSGKVWRGQFHNKKKNGELYWEAVSISAILNELGDIVNYIEIGEDISQQKNTEAELKIALEKALESDRLKSAFLANMSHEIRTPMNGILGFVNLLNKPNLAKSKADKYSSIINKSGERLLNTINDIIDISKIEAGETIITNTETSINNIMEELHSFFTPEANLKELSLTIEPSLSAEQIMVITDGNKLHGILSNLIKNAIKYTEKGNITFGYLVKEDFIEFFVKDSGVGIPKNRLQAIFNRFEQADIEDSRVFEGSGLGLAISKAYTEMLGGNIFAESTFGKGSKFKFTIPYTKISEQKPEQVSAYSDNNIIKIENLNLLIAEDDIISSELLKSSLQGLFKEITIVDNGIDAIEACRNKPEINLVLMDIKMPKMNGHDATTEIRKFNKDLVIIAQTAYALRGDKEKAIEAGCNDYITKPINKKLLLEIINKFID